MLVYTIELENAQIDTAIVYSDINIAVQVLAYMVSCARLATASKESTALTRTELTNEFMIACKIAYKKFESEIIKQSLAIDDSQELYNYYLKLGNLMCECANPQTIPRSFPIFESVDYYNGAVVISSDVKPAQLTEVQKGVYQINTKHLSENKDFELSAYFCLVDNFNKTRTESFSPYTKVEK